MEQINRWMKVSGVLVGITLNKNARHRFFLISADLVQLTEEAKEMTRDSEAARKRHHELSQANRKSKQRMLKNLPFSCQENDIINLVTKAVMLETIKQNICLIEEVGVAKMEIFIQERIKTEQMNIWATMQKVRPQTWSASLKNVHVAISNNVLEL